MNSMGILLLSKYFNFLEMRIQLESSLFAYGIKQKYPNGLNVINIENKVNIFSSAYRKGIF